MTTVFSTVVICGAFTVVVNEVDVAREIEVVVVVAGISGETSREEVVSLTGVNNVGNSLRFNMMIFVLNGEKMNVLKFDNAIFRNGVGRLDADEISTVINRFVSQFTDTVEQGV
jgi:ABC-type lipopolysaccharide export system ATPase subunit